LSRTVFVGYARRASLTESVHRAPTRLVEEAGAGASPAQDSGKDPVLSKMPNEREMSEKTVTLKLQGVVTVAAFSKALQSFTALIRELSTDAKARGMAWDVTGLEAGSAQVTVCADLADRFTEQQADLVAEVYLAIGRKLAQRESLLGYRVCACASPLSL